MSRLQPIEAIVNHNEDSLRTLTRAITRSQGEFTLILARCNDPGVRGSIAEQLHQQCAVPVREFILDRTAKTLYTSLTQRLDCQQPSAMMVYGLESVDALDGVLIATNQVREKFRNFACPLVLWVTDEVLRKLIRLVPDFENWATTIEFTGVPEEAPIPKPIYSAWQKSA